MRTKIMLLIACAFLLFAVTAVTPAQDENKKPEQDQKKAAPKAVIPERVHDFGNVKPGTPLNYSFVIKNEGTGDLTIYTVKGAPGLTVVDFDKVIAPGKEGKISLAMNDTKDYTGKVRQSAMVNMNDTKSPAFLLIMAANFTQEEIPAPQKKP